MPNVAIHLHEELRTVQDPPQKDAAEVYQHREHHPECGEEAQRMHIQDGVVQGTAGPTRGRTVFNNPLIITVGLPGGGLLDQRTTPQKQYLIQLILFIFLSHSNLITRIKQKSVLVTITTNR